MGSIPVAHPTPPRRLRFRRAPIFVGILALSVGVAILLLVAFASPGDGPDDAIVVAGLEGQFAGDSVTYFPEHQFYLVKLDIVLGGLPTEPLFLALSDSAQHLEGETVEWLPDFEFNRQRGWFRSPMHGETFARFGVLAFGPASGNMDRYAVTVEHGKVIVDTSTRMRVETIPIPE